MWYVEYRYITFFSLHFCRAVLSALLSTRTRKSYSIAWDECGLQPLVLWAVEEDHTRTCSSFSPELLSLAQLFWSDFSSLSTLQWSSDWCQVHFHFCVQKLLCVHRGLSSGCCFYHLHFFAKKVTLTSFFFWCHGRFGHLLLTSTVRYIFGGRLPLDSSLDLRKRARILLCWTVWRNTHTFWNKEKRKENRTTTDRMGNIFKKYVCISSQALYRGAFRCNQLMRYAFICRVDTRQTKNSSTQCSILSIY